MESLKRKKDFKDLVVGGKKLRPAPWLIINYNYNESGLLRYGWTASGKIGTAVIRNKLKRWCREFLKQKEKSDDPAGVDINFLFLKPKTPGFYKELKHAELDQFLEKAWRSIHRPNK